MRFYIAEIVATGIAFLCALTNHAGACAVWRWLWEVDLWATETMMAQGVDQRHRFIHPVPVSPSRPTCFCQAEVTATSGATSATFRYCPRHGMVRDA